VGRADAADEFPTGGLRDFIPPTGDDRLRVVDDASRDFPAPGSALGK